MRRKAGDRGQNARDTANAIEQVLYQHSDRAAPLHDRQNGAINLHTKQWQIQLKDGSLTVTAFDNNREILKVNDNPEGMTQQLNNNRSRSKGR